MRTQHDVILFNISQYEPKAIEPREAKPRMIKKDHISRGMFTRSWQCAQRTLHAKRVRLKVLVQATVYGLPEGVS